MMTTLTALSLVAVATTAIAKDAPGGPSWLSPGATLTYQVQHAGDTYDFVVTPTAMDDGVAWSWRMGAPKNISGKRTITANALATCRSHNNFFRPDEALTLTDACSVWISRAARTELHEGGKTEAVIDGRPVTLTLAGKTTRKVSIDGKETDLAALELKSEKGDWMLVLDDPKHPIILHQRVGFEVGIQKIETKR